MTWTLERASGPHRYHQQYLHHTMGGYCPDHGTGISCPIEQA